MTWRPVWASGDALNLRVEATDTRAGTRYRVRTGSPSPTLGADGAVVLCVRGGRELVVVEQERVGLGLRLWELPRGAADADDAGLVATGLRELCEETGIAAAEGTVLGGVHPDSGVLGTTVAVVLVHVDAAASATADGVEVDAARWVPLDALPGLVARGELRDGISLAALALLWAQPPGGATG